MNRFIGDFRENAASFNSFFSNRYLLATNRSVLSKDHELFKDDKALISQQISRSWYHKHLIKIYSNSIYNSLGLAFGFFFKIERKSNVVPIHKKMDEKSIKDHTLVSLLQKVDKSLKGDCTCFFVSLKMT